MTEQHIDTTGDGRRLRATLIAAAVAVAVIVGGLGVANAQTTTTEKSSSDRDGGGGGTKARDGGALHGERVVRGPDGGYQTIGHQVGEVTKVSESSITVRSEDDYTRTYSVGDDTIVTAGNAGIADVKQGDVVDVVAIVRGERAAAVSIDDLTQIKRIRAKQGGGDRDAQRRRGPGPGGPR